MIKATEKFKPQQIKTIKRDGSLKVRDLAVPSDETRAKHAQTLRMLYSLDVVSAYATGGIPGKKLIDNALPHRKNRSFYLIDLKDAFPTTDIASLQRFVETPVVPKEHKSPLIHFIGNWATTPLVPGLPLGAPASPYLFNMYCQPLDENLGEYCDYRGITYTRYLDDLTFSAQQPIGHKTRRTLRNIVTDSTDMTINHAKSRVHSLEHGPVTVTGVSIYEGGRIGPNPQLIDRTIQVFSEVGSRAVAGQLVYEDEVGLIHGYRGAVQQMSFAGSRIAVNVEAAYTDTLQKLGIYQ